MVPVLISICIIRKIEAKNETFERMMRITT